MRFIHREHHVNFCEKNIFWYQWCDITGWMVVQAMC